MNDSISGGKAEQATAGLEAKASTTARLKKRGESVILCPRDFNPEGIGAEIRENLFGTPDAEGNYPREEVTLIVMDEEI
ncbi:MAG: hypothetical protein A2V88_09175 [Elusimicrobia bacterium RBG_16_66_12]|nr:MAG: hypothetical protein A2V88_09175 [Elusimicrobia bacterium RBG_16_66_12]